MAVVNGVTFQGASYDLTTKANEKSKNGILSQTHDFVSSGYGAYRLTQWPAKFLNLIAETGVSAGIAVENVAPLKNVSSIFNTAANGMIFSHWLWTGFEFRDQLSKVAEEGSGENCLELFRRGVECATATCHSAAYFVAEDVKKTLGSISVVTDLVNDTIEAYQAASRWIEADQFLNQGASLSSEVQEGLKSKKTLNMIWLAAKVVAVAAGIFAVLAKIAGTAALTPLALAIVGFTTCTLAILKHFFKVNMSNDVLKTRVQLPEVV